MGSDSIDLLKNIDSIESDPIERILGYVDYGVCHGATLEVDIEDGRFVFFCLPVEMPE